MYRLHQRLPSSRNRASRRPRENPPTPTTADAWTFMEKSEADAVAHQKRQRDVLTSAALNQFLDDTAQMTVEQSVDRIRKTLPPLACGTDAMSATQKICLSGGKMKIGGSTTAC